MRLKEFMETDIYKLAEIIEYVDRNGEEIEEDKENLLLFDVIDYHKGQQAGLLEIELNIDVYYMGNLKMTERNIEEILTGIILNNAEGTKFEDCEIRTFKEAEILTLDKGIVIDLPNGASILLTIQGYNSNGIRMN